MSNVRLLIKRDASSGWRWSTDSRLRLFNNWNAHVMLSTPIPANQVKQSLLPAEIKEHLDTISIAGMSTEYEYANPFDGNPDIRLTLNHLIYFTEARDRLANSLTDVTRWVARVALKRMALFASIVLGIALAIYASVHVDYEDITSVLRAAVPFAIAAGLSLSMLIPTVAMRAVVAAVAPSVDDTTVRDTLSWSSKDKSDDFGIRDRVDLEASLAASQSGLINAAKTEGLRRAHSLASIFGASTGIVLSRYLALCHPSFLESVQEPFVNAGFMGGFFLNMLSLLTPLARPSDILPSDYATRSRNLVAANITLVTKEN